MKMTKFEEEYHELEAAVSPYRPKTNIFGQSIYDTPTKKQLLNVFKDWQPPLKKVVIPQRVADWIEDCKSGGRSLEYAVGDHESRYDSESNEWLQDLPYSFEIFARAWLDGYEVEKEPLYWIKLGSGNDSYFYSYTNKSTGEVGQSFGNSFFEDSSYNSIGYVYKQKFTRAEIKAIDERYWAFAVPVE